MNISCDHKKVKVIFDDELDLAWICLICKKRLTEYEEKVLGLK